MIGLKWRHAPRLTHLMRQAFCADKMVQFSDVEYNQQLEEKNVGVTNGRAWRASELRLKSNEDLHKLWYTMLKERNACLSDNNLYNKVQMRAPKKARLLSIKQTMSRLLTVVNERKKVRENYRRHLEDEYIAEQRQRYMEQVASQEQVEVPAIDQKLLAAKMKALKRGEDNLEYIEQAVAEKKAKQAKREAEWEKYDYSRKKVVSAEEQVEEEESVIRQFSSSVQKSLREGTPIKMSQEELLKSHVTNWKMLTIKQKRVVMGFLNARRARESKELFRQELDLVRQKVQHDLKLE